jgi:hypothetical protein
MNRKGWKRGETWLMLTPPAGAAGGSRLIWSQVSKLTPPPFLMLFQIARPPLPLLVQSATSEATKAISTPIPAMPPARSKKEALARVPAPGTVQAEVNLAVRRISAQGERLPVQRTPAITRPAQFDLVLSRRNRLDRAHSPKFKPHVNKTSSDRRRVEVVGFDVRWMLALFCHRVFRWSFAMPLSRSAPSLVLTFGSEPAPGKTKPTLS